MSEKLEKKVIGALLGFRNGTKTPREVLDAIENFKKINPHLADDYYKKFIAAAKVKQEESK